MDLCSIVSSFSRVLYTFVCLFRRYRDTSRNLKRFVRSPAIIIIGFLVLFFGTRSIDKWSCFSFLFLLDETSRDLKSCSVHSVHSLVFTVGIGFFPHWIVHGCTFVKVGRRYLWIMSRLISLDRAMFYIAVLMSVPLGRRGVNLSRQNKEIFNWWDQHALFEIINDSYLVSLMELQVPLKLRKVPAERLLNWQSMSALTCSIIV